MGVKDDIIGTAPMKKLGAHMIVGFIMVIMTDIRIESMHGIFGMNEPFRRLAELFIIIICICRNCKCFQFNRWNRRSCRWDRVYSCWFFWVNIFVFW